MNVKAILCGHYELKRIYRRNMLLSFGLAGGLHLVIIAIFAVVTSADARKPIEAPPSHQLTEFWPPPTIKKTDNQIEVFTSESGIRPSIGIPEPVPDDMAAEEVRFASQNDLTALAPENPIEGLEGLKIDVDVESILEEFLPDPEIFIPCQEYPVQIKTVTPEYPPIAQRAGVEGAVWVKALVDKEGRVRDVVIVKESGADAGFEDAAMEAARQSIWKPAIANGLPIALWVIYKVEFILKKN